MTKNDFDIWFEPIYDQVNNLNFKLIKIDDGGFWDKEEPDFPNQEPYNLIPDESVKLFYTFINDWGIKWSNRTNVEINAQGTFNILPLDQVMQDSWDDTLGGNDWAPDMKGFRPLDMFYDMDGFVGFYIKRPDKNGLYLQHSDSSISPLHLNLDGYLQLLGMSKGFGWWQNALVQIHSGKEMPNVAGFKEKMPKIFPDFSWEEFVELYEKVRIDK